MELFDEDGNTGIHLDSYDPVNAVFFNDNTLRFDTAGFEGMTISAGGTVHIKKGLQDGYGLTGTTSQVLSATGTSTRWVDLTQMFDKNRDTGIQVEKVAGDNSLYFYAGDANDERMSINASGTVHIVDAIKGSSSTSGRYFPPPERGHDGCTFPSPHPSTLKPMTGLPDWTSPH